MTKHIICLVGEQQSGKTTLARMFESRGADVLLIGEALRLKRSAQSFAAEENSYAAPSVEQEVQEMLIRKLNEFALSDFGVLVIDSAPKNVEQLRLLVNERPLKSMLSVFVSRDDYAVRMNRARARYGNDLMLFNAREPHEQRWIDLLSVTCERFAVNCFIFDKRKGKK